MKKFEILNLEKKAIARLNDQQIIAIKGGVAENPCPKTFTVLCNGATTGITLNPAN
jgi:hypothetical protein